MAVDAQIWKREVLLLWFCALWVSTNSSCMHLGLPIFWCNFKFL